MKFIRKITKKEGETLNSKDAAKERLHLVLMQDRANVSADFLELMKQEIIEVIKKYIDVDENAIDVRLTNKENGDGTKGAPALYANIPIVNIKDEVKQNEKKDNQEVKQDKEEKVEQSQAEEAKEKEVKEEQEQSQNSKSNTSTQDNEEIKEPEEVINEEQVETNEKETVQNTEN